MANSKQQMTGIVVSDKMDKTVVVKVILSKRHPKYHKSYKLTKRVKAHDEDNQYHTGDTVLIESIPPMSAQKRFKVVGKA